jgi:hypothetical protein
VRDDTDKVILPEDPNADARKVVADEPGEAHVASRDAGTFLLNAGQNHIDLYHYAQISDRAPQFLNGPIRGAESVYLQGLMLEYLGAAPKVLCTVNDIPARREDSLFVANIPLQDGWNDIIAVCAVTDSVDRQTTVSDTIRVFKDNVLPYCDFQPTDTGLLGTFFDDHGGIFAIREVEIRNGELTVADFTPGANSVDFRIDIVDPNKNLFFSIDIVDLCGNVYNCDPVFLVLDADHSVKEHRFNFPIQERYFRVDNKGLNTIRAELNGNAFMITSDMALVEETKNIFYMPVHGVVVIDLDNTLKTDNGLHLYFDGPGGSEAQIEISPDASAVDYVLRLLSLPDEFRLSQNYPNPFNPTTRISFDVAEDAGDGVRVVLQIFNLRGQLVRVLMDKEKAPGNYTLEWDGAGDNGFAVPSGVYIYRIRAGDFQKTRRMVLVR